MSTLVNFFDCNSARLGTGTPSCDIPTGVPTGFFLVPKTWRLDTTTETFDSAYITAQIKAGTMIPFLGAINFTDNSEESVIYTTQLGVKLLASLSLPLIFPKDIASIVQLLAIILSGVMMLF